MEVFGKRDQEAIDRLLAVKAACEAAGLPVPDAIAERLGEGYEDKSPNELCTAPLPSGVVQFYQAEEGRAGVRILLNKLPADTLELLVLPPRQTSDSDEKPEPTSTELGASSTEKGEKDEGAIPPSPEAAIKLPDSRDRLPLG